MGPEDRVYDHWPKRPRQTTDRTICLWSLNSGIGDRVHWRSTACLGHHPSIGGRDPEDTTWLDILDDHPLFALLTHCYMVDASYWSGKSTHLFSWRLECHCNLWSPPYKCPQPLQDTITPLLGRGSSGLIIYRLFGIVILSWDTNLHIPAMSLFFVPLSLDFCHIESHICLFVYFHI